jgi:glycosyltransferase involved in cell wall biosynthesis
MDVYCAPFDEGASTRRGSLLAGLQHGLPTVSTVGRRTDQALRAEHESALLLAPDDEPQAFAACVVQLATNPPLRREVGRAAEAFFETTFSWPVIANQLLAGLYPGPVSPDSQPSSSPFVSAS